MSLCVTTCLSVWSLEYIHIFPKRSFPHYWASQKEVSKQDPWQCSPPRKGHHLSADGLRSTWRSYTRKCVGALHLVASCFPEEGCAVLMGAFWMFQAAVLCSEPGWFLLTKTELRTPVVVMCYELLKRKLGFKRRLSLDVLNILKYT